MTLSVLRFFTEHRVIEITVETQDVLNRHSTTWTSAKGIRWRYYFSYFQPAIDSFILNEESVRKNTRKKLAMNQIILWKDMTLFWGSNPKAVTEHRHPTIQMVLATQNSFKSKNSAGEWIDKTGLLIAPNHAHQCDATNVHILSLDIDPESALGEWILTHQLDGKQIIDFPPNSIQSFHYQELAQKIDNKKWSEIRSLIENAVHYQPSFQPSEKDRRIEDVLDFIAQNINTTITTKTLTDVAHLSESRLLHLFKEHMGLPIRNYILWYRLKIVMNHIMEGQSLTTAAHNAGFSDQAHMTRTFSNMIGVSPSTFSKNSKFVQVSYPS